ncbi:MAG: Alpha-ribazole-5-phosphate phosphatase [Labilithrix sp.]|nr:Alpha-ribazole-5-phosphate phosphatase [Labilithrix sp.]
MMQLFVVRHAPAQLSGVCYGQIDVPVAPPADEAARAAIASLDALVPPPARPGPSTRTAPFTSIVTSPSARTRTLAEAMARKLDMHPPRIDERLRELDFGRWEGRSWAELERDDGPAFTDWMTNWEHARVPGGEGVGDLMLRLEALLDEHARAGAYCLFVTHAGPIRVLRALLQKRTLGDVWSEGVPHLSVQLLTI